MSKRKDVYNFKRDIDTGKDLFKHEKNVPYKNLKCPP